MGKCRTPFALGGGGSGGYVLLNYSSPPQQRQRLSVKRCEETSAKNDITAWFNVHVSSLFPYNVAIFPFLLFQWPCPLLSTSLLLVPNLSPKQSAHFPLPSQNPHST